MIILGTKIFDLLSADAPCVAIMADRIYPSLGKQRGALPYLVWQEIVSIGQQTHDDGQGLDRTDIQFNCYATDVAVAFALRKVVRAALMAAGAMAGVKVMNPVQRTFFEDQVALHSAQLDLTFWHNQST